LGYLLPPRSDCFQLTLAVFQPTPFLARLKATHPLMSFVSTSERMTVPNHPGIRRILATFHGISVPIATSAHRIHLDERASQPRPKFRPQRSTRSRRFAPRCALRVYFTPQPCLGFTFQGFSPRPSRPDSSSCRALMTFPRPLLPPGEPDGARVAAAPSRL